MAHVVADRVRETTTTTGTGTYTLAGAVTGFETFGSIGNSNTTYYCCTDGTNFEVGVGTYTSSGTTLARTTILQSSNSDNAVNWSSGTRQIFCTAPAEKSVILDPNNDTTIKSSDGAILKLQTSDTTVADGDVIGAIEFSAPDEASGTDAVTTAASIVAEADDTFAADNNKTDLVIKLGKSEAAVERARFAHEGGLSLTGYDTDANPDPSLSLTRDTASPADGDFIGSIYFYGKNSADNLFAYAAILAVSNDVTDGTEDGKLIFRVGDAGTEAWSGSSNNLITLTADTIAFDASSGTTFGGHDISSVGEISASTLRLTSTTDLSVSSTGHGFQVGSSSSTNISIDNNEIMARNNGSTSTLYLNFNGGAVQVGGGIVIEDAGNIGSASDTDAISIASNGQVTFTQTLIGTDLDISGDVDVDGTLEADAMTLNGTAITTTATLSTGISNNNVPKFTSGVADNDFLRVDGTAIEGRSASEVLSDIGGTTASDAANEATALAIALG